VAITSTNPGGAVPPDYRKQRLTLSALEIGEVISGVFTSAGSPGTAFSYTIASTNVTTATAGLETALDAKAAAGTGTAWAEVTVTNGTTYLDVFSWDADGELLFSSTPPGGSSVTTKMWIGDAVGVAQVTQVTPLNVLTGDSFSLKINSKVITVVATAATAANVVALFLTAINATAIPEWREVEASVSGDTLILTARIAGVPFTVESGSSDAVGLEITTTIAGSAGTNAVQQFAIPISAAGTFAITFGDQTTTAIAVGANAATVLAALEALSNIGTGDVGVTNVISSDGNDNLYLVTFQNALANTPVAQLIVDLTSTKPLIRTTQQGSTTGTVQNEKQTIDFTGSSGVFTLTLDGQTTGNLQNPGLLVDYSATIASALMALSNVERVSVTKLTVDHAADDSFSVNSQRYEIEFISYDGSAGQSQLTASTYASSGDGNHRIPITNTAGIAAVNEVQKIAIQGTATGGTFTLTYAGQTTSAIAYNASAATVDTALEALSNIGVGDVNVTGPSGGPWLVEFTGALAGGDRAQITATSSLTGSAASNVTVTTTTASSGPNHWDTAANWLPSGVPVNGDDVRFELGSTDCLYGLSQAGVTLDSLWVMQGFGGAIGLPRVNENGYLEYRTRELTIGITDLRVGDGEEGTGPRKVAINTGTVVTTITVRNSGDSSEANVPCVIWRGDNVANVIVVDDGDFGCSWWSDETSRFSKLTQRGGNVFLRYATIVDELTTTNQEFRAFKCTLGTKPFNI